jgi:hypothetical protein
MSNRYNQKWLIISTIILNLCFSATLITEYQIDNNLVDSEGNATLT